MDAAITRNCDVLCPDAPDREQHVRRDISCIVALEAFLERADRGTERTRGAPKCA
jgi:hypothetical protein